MKKVSRDRLSELPDPLVLNILSFLPTRDAVKTTLLAKQFKDLWTTVPRLDFKSDVNDTNENDGEEDEFGIIRYRNTRFQNFVNRALILWRGTKILEFKVEIFHYESPPFNDLDVWLRIAMENEVEKLYVNLLTDWKPAECPEFTEYFPPQHLYSCSSIRELYLAGCGLEISGNVQWDQLKYLKIEGVSLGEHAMNQILSNSPQLEVLSLSLSEVCEALNIFSSSLKALKIEKFNFDRGLHHRLVCSVMTIWAPNIESLEILGDPYGEYVMKNVSSLTNAIVDINFVEYYDSDVPDDGDCFHFSGYLALVDFMRISCETNRHVEKVTLSGWCIKLLNEMKWIGDGVVEQLSNAKSLKLYDCQVGELKGLLKIFDKLTKLIFEKRLNQRGIYQIRWSAKDPSIPSITKFDTGFEWYYRSQKRSLRSCLLHLRTVEIAWNPDEGSMFPIVEFLLRNASKLEKLVIQVKESGQYAPEYWLLRADKLLKIPRLSPTAEVFLRRE